MKVSERRTGQKNWKEVFSTINKKPWQFHLIKRNNEVNLRTREAFLFYRKPQKLKIA